MDVLCYLQIPALVVQVFIELVQGAKLEKSKLCWSRGQGPDQQCVIEEQGVREEVIRPVISCSTIMPASNPHALHHGGS